MALLTHHRAMTVLALALTACGGETTIGTGQDSLVFEVDHYDGVCEGNGPWYCPRVREVDADQSWRDLPCDITDLDRKWGYRYVVEVTTFPKEDVPHGCGTTGHQLVEVLEETPVEAGTRFSREVRAYELFVNDEGRIVFVHRSLDCQDAATCDDLASVIAEDDSARLNVVFEHATPGEEPKLVRFDVLP